MKTYQAKNGLVMDLDYVPKVALEDTKKVTREEWLEVRKSFIGGSDYGAITGVSPWKTAYDVYMEKRRETKTDEAQENWVALEVGTRLEELVAKVFCSRTGLRPYAIHKVFKHPVYYWMGADVDYFVDITDRAGKKRTMILEIKTTSYQNRLAWGTDEEPKIPEAYAMQGLSYACVTNTAGVIFACLYDNNEDSLIIRTLNRDLDREAEIIETGRRFWQEHVEKRIPPKQNTVKSAKSWLKKPENTETSVIPGNRELADGETYADIVNQITKLTEKKAEAEKQKKEYEKEIDRLKAEILAGIGKSRDTLIQVPERDTDLMISFKTRVTESVSVQAIRDLKEIDPETYDSLKNSRFIKEKEISEVRFLDKKRKEKK